MLGLIDCLKIEVNGLRKAYTSCARFTKPTSSSPVNHSDGIECNPVSAAESSPHGLMAEMEALGGANARMEDGLAWVRGDNA